MTERLQRYISEVSLGVDAQHSKLFSQTSIMKLYISAILAVVGSASATLIYPSTGTGCSNNVGTIKSCGKTGLSNYNIRSARVNFEKATATFYHDAGCKGVKLSVASDKCIQFTQWSPKCVEIHGGTC